MADTPLPVEEVRFLPIGRPFYQADPNSMWMDTTGTLRLGQTDRVALVKDIPSRHFAEFTSARVAGELTVTSMTAYGKVDAPHATVCRADIQELNVKGATVLTDVTAAAVSCTSVIAGFISSQSANMDSIVINGNTKTSSMWSDTSVSKHITCRGALSALDISAKSGTIDSLNVGGTVHDEAMAMSGRRATRLQSPLNALCASIRRGALDHLPGYEDCMLHVNGPAFHIRLFAPAVLGSMNLVDAKRLVDALSDACKEMNQSTMSAFEECAHVGCVNAQVVGTLYQTAEIYCCAIEVAKAIVTLGLPSFHAHRWRWMAEHLASAVKYMSLKYAAATGASIISPAEVVQFANRHAPVADSYATDDPYVTILCDLCALMCGTERIGCLTSVLSKIHWSLGLAVHKRLQHVPLISNGFLVAQASGASLDLIRMPYMIHALDLDRTQDSSSPSETTSPSGKYNEEILSLEHIWAKHAIGEADFRMIVKDTHADFKVHAWLVAGVWPYFRRVLEASLAEATERRLAFESDRFPADALIHVVNYIYGTNIKGGAWWPTADDASFVEEFDLHFVYPGVVAIATNDK